MQEDAIRYSHTGVTNHAKCKSLAGHKGVTRTVDTIRQRLYFPDMTERVRQYIKGCAVCQQMKSASGLKGASQMRPVPVPRKSFAQIGIDMIGPLPEVDGYKYIVTAVDYFTKFIEVHPLRQKNAFGICKFIYNLICRYGASEVYISDNGSEFVNEINRTLFQWTGMQHRCVAPYNPR